MNPYFKPYKINLEQKINVRAKIIKLLKENIDVSLCYLGLRSIFLII